MSRPPERPLPACRSLGSSVRAKCDEVSCQELVASLDAYLAGELPPVRHAVLDRHLALCPDCRNYLDSYRKTIELGRAAVRGSGEIAIPPELFQAILAAQMG